MTPPPPTSSPPTRRYSVLYYKRSFGSSLSSSASASTIKNRGNSARSDGILSIAPPPSCVCKLISADDGDEEEEIDDDDEEDEDDDVEDDKDGSADRTGSKKQMWNKFKNKKQQTAKKKKKSRKLKQQHHRRRPNAIVWSGVNTDLSRRAYSDSHHDTTNGGLSATMTMICEDDTLVLNGQWACEIVSTPTTGCAAATSSIGSGRSGDLLINDRSSPAMLVKQQQPLSKRFVGGKLLGKPGSTIGTAVGKTGMTSDSASTSGTMKMPPAPLSSMRANVIQPLRSKKTAAGLGHGVTRLTELPPTRVGLGGGRSGAGAGAPSHASVCRSASSATEATAVAVEQVGGGSKVGEKRQKNAAEGTLDNGESDGEDSIHDENVMNDNPSSYKIPPSLLRSAPTFSKRPRTAPTLGEAALTSSTNSNDEFPGAKGERITVPTSLRNVLRPHQREGIAFLWNCVTGVNEGLKNAYHSTVGSASASAGDSLDLNEDTDDDNHVGSVALPSGDAPRGAVLADEMGLGKVRSFLYNNRWHILLLITSGYYMKTLSPFVDAHDNRHNLRIPPSPSRSTLHRGMPFQSRYQLVQGV